MKERRIHDFLPEIKDYYTINDLGEIFSDNSGLMKSRNKGDTTYKIVNLSKIDGSKQTFRVHRLVLMAFKPNENMNSLEVNHLDGDKSNNRLENLEWCTKSENQKHAFKTGLNEGSRGEKSNFAKLSKEDIKAIFGLRKLGKTQREIAENFNCTRSNISYILNKKTWNE